MTIERRAFLIGAMLAAAAQPAHATRSSPLERAESHFIEANGIRLHYLKIGSGPAVVLLHGWPQTSAAWVGTMARLKGRFTLIAPDLRGIGLSQRPPSGYDKRTLAADVADLIAQVPGGRAHVVAHDMGGKAAYMLAHLHPERVDRLVLVDCLVPGTENMDARRGGAWHYGFHMAPDIPELLTAGRERAYIAAQIRNWSHRKDAIGATAISEFARHYATPGGMSAGFALYRALPEDATFAASLADKKLNMPILAIAGAHGVGSHLTEALRGKAQNLTSVIAPDSGHFVPEEMPDFFCEHVCRFLTA